LYTQNPDPDPC